MKRVLACGLLSLVACASAGPGTDAASAEAVDPPAVVRPSGAGVPAMKVGQVLAIERSGNASTGYQWQWVEDGSPVLARIAPPPAAVPAEEPAEPGRVGAPRMSRWWFKAVQPGRTTLRLVYRRPWETDAPPAQTAEYTVTVE